MSTLQKLLGRLHLSSLWKGLLNRMGIEISMAGLTDNQQAILTFLSMMFIAIGTASIPAGAPWYAVLTLELIGVVGLTIKEFLGTDLPSATTTGASGNSSTAGSGNSTSSSSGAAASSSTTATLPALPSGFSLSAVKSAGFKVYENQTGNIILFEPGATGETVGEYTNIYGTVLGASVDLTGYTQL